MVDAALVYTVGVLVLFCFWIYGIVAFVRDLKNYVIPWVRQYRAGDGRNRDPERGQGQGQERADPAGETESRYPSGNSGSRPGHLARHRGYHAGARGRDIGLDVPVPDPPSLSGPQTRGDYEAIGDPADDPGDDYRREEIADVLADGAWADAFDEWASETDLSPAEFELVDRLGLFEAFEFYWDPATDDVGYRAPGLPEDARADVPATQADGVEGKLDSLGRVVSETLENDYLRRDEDTFGFFADEEPTDEYEFRDEA